MMSLRNKLYPRGLTPTEEWERYSLRRDGAQFHITHADIRIAPEYLARLDPWFAPVGVNLASIATIQQLAEAYLKWYAAATEKERRQIPLKAGARSVPKTATSDEHMERRVLLSMTRYIHVQNVIIRLTDVGVASVANVCNTMGIDPASITTLARFARLGSEFADYGLAKMLGVSPGDSVKGVSWGMKPPQF